MHTGGAAAPPLWRKRAGGRYMRQKAAQFSVGAAGYSALEIAVRGHTHWTMAVLGGLCLCALCVIARSFSHRSIVFQAALGAAFITAAEFATGVVVNLWRGWTVWDYTKEAGDILGQICPLFTFYWFCLCCGVFGALRLARRHLAGRVNT